MALENLRGTLDEAQAVMEDIPAGAISIGTSGLFMAYKGVPSSSIA